MLQRYAGLSLVLFVLAPTLGRADTFDNYFNKLLAKIPEAKSVEKIAKLTPKVMIKHNRALPDVTGPVWRRAGRGESGARRRWGVRVTGWA